MDLIFQIVFTIIGAFLSVVLTRILIQNGRLIQKMHEDMKEGFKRMDERTARIADLITVEADKTRELIRELKSTS